MMVKQKRFLVCSRAHFPTSKSIATLCRRFSSTNHGLQGTTFPP